jgi:hypothetical protein
MPGNGLPAAATAHRLAALLLTAGLLVAFSGLWRLASVEQRPFGQFRVEATLLQERFAVAAQAAGGWTAVLFWDPTCPCAARSARAAEALLRELPSGSRLAVVVPREDWRGRAERRFARLEPAVWSGESLPSPPSAPALALVDERQRLRYIGPHGAAAGCGDSLTRPQTAGALLAAFLAAGERTVSPTAVRGCFCPWTAHQTSISLLHLQAHSDPARLSAGQHSKESRPS